jgi:hypothetical protein
MVAAPWSYRHEIIVLATVPKLIIILILPLVLLLLTLFLAKVIHPPIAPL